MKPPESIDKSLRSYCGTLKTEPFKIKARISFTHFMEDDENALVLSRLILFCNQLCVLLAMARILQDNVKGPLPPLPFHRSGGPRCSSEVEALRIPPEAPPEERCGEDSKWLEYRPMRVMANPWVQGNSSPFVLRGSISSLPNTQVVRDVCPFRRAMRETSVLLVHHTGARILLPSSSSSASFPTSGTRVQQLL